MGGIDEHEGSDGGSRRLTPSISFAPPALRDRPVGAGANEDFLFHLYRGSELLQDNRVHEAKEELEQALGLQPRDTKGRDLLAVVYFRLGLFDQAIALYEALRKTNPRDPALLVNLALCYLKTGQPALARRELEQVVRDQPDHGRAWGYLGIACERLGDLVASQRAFEQGGHGQLARRIAGRRGVTTVAMEAITPEVRTAAAAAFEELDAGELSFALAEATSDASSAKWTPVEPGKPATRRRISVRPDTIQPDTRDGPPPVPALPQQGPPPSMARRPTLIVGPPPAAAVLVPPLTASLDDIGDPLSMRVPVIELPEVRTEATMPGVGPGGDLQQAGPTEGSTPPLVHAPSPSQASAAANGPTPGNARAEFPERGAALHPTGLALVRTTATSGFAARLEAVRVASNGLTMNVLERQAKGKSTGEPFGGAFSPLALVTGEGQLVLAPRAGRRLTHALLNTDDTCFVREDVLLGFEEALTFENGKLATGEGESFAVVQLRGAGHVLLETAAGILSLKVAASRGLSVRREAVLGWFGRLVPRALAPSEAPCNQRGLVSFAGDGRVLVASA